MASLLHDLPRLAFVFVMVLARAGSAAMLLPGLGEAELPPMVRAGAALTLTVLLVPLVAPLLGPEPAGPGALVAALCCEIGTGLWMGWLSRVVMQVPAMAGQAIAAAVGVTNVLQADADQGGQTSAVAHALTLAAPVAVLASGLYALPIEALAHSYDVLPAGHPLAMADGSLVALRLLSRCFALAVELAGPFVLASTVWHVALGLLGRLVPQLQFYFAAMPGQIAGGLAMLALLAGSIMIIWQHQAEALFLALPGH
jgi:flagellar biosynthesis protein FliR